jgi:parallel beta-helix repeat protein
MTVLRASACLVPFLLSLILGSTARSAYVFVPDNQPTIQAAIDSAAAGDVIVVRPGTYSENIDFGGKGVTVTSELGADVTVIDGGQAGSVVTFANSEGPASIVAGFTITNGSAQNGGGIYCYRSTPTIANNVITGNEAILFYGGGIFCEEADATITGNRITTNTADKRGGGICAYTASPTITGNTIEDNSAFGSPGGAAGGGIACFTSASLIDGNIISGNTAVFSAGIECYASTLTISDNVVTENSADFAAGIGISAGSSAIVRGNLISGNTAIFSGGGLDCNGSYAEIADNVISGNVVTVGAAGGISIMTQSNPLLVNNIICGNTAALLGGGVAVDWSTPLLVNNTITENAAVSNGGGFFCSGTADVTMVNTILWGNSASLGQEIYVDRQSALTISYSDVEGGQGSAFVDPLATLTWGAGMVDADPLFADATAGDYHIFHTSLCRNAGDAAAPGLPATDFEGDSRPTGAAPDMGADEFAPHLYHVGDVLPGQQIEIKIVSDPATYPVKLALGSHVLDPPFPTPHGDLFLPIPLLNTWQLPGIPATGIHVVSITIPVTASPGDTYPLQVLTGFWGGNGLLTNLLLLTVE